MLPLIDAIDRDHRATLSWHAESLDRDLTLQVYYKQEKTGEPAPVVLYLMNHGAERIGLEPDESIVTDYIHQGYIVILVDFKGEETAVSPDVDMDLWRLYRGIYGAREPDLLEGTGLVPERFRCFILPAGYRVARDLTFWDIKKHGAHGTMEHILSGYNRHIVRRFGVDEAMAPDEMVTRDGEPMDFSLRMDIVYPSGADETVPLVYWAGTSHQREPNMNPFRTPRIHFAGFLMRGYAYAHIDHLFNPVHRYYTIGQFSLGAWNGLAANTAAIRFFREHAAEYAIDSERIAGWGHSKGAYSVIRLSDPDHENQGEALTFDGQPEGSPEPQPWPGHSSRITAAYHSMGGSDGPHSWRRYMTSDAVPTVIACGDEDRYGNWVHWPYQKRTFDEYDGNHVALGMRGLGHDLPYGFDERLGVDRYRLVHEFFDQYMVRGNERRPPSVLYQTPADGTEASTTSDVLVHFAPQMDRDSVQGGVDIVRVASGEEIEGEWTGGRDDTLFTFSPSGELVEGEAYEVIVGSGVESRRGIGIGEETVARFQVGEQTGTGADIDDEEEAAAMVADFSEPEEFALWRSGFTAQDAEHEREPMDGIDSNGTAPPVARFAVDVPEESSPNHVSMVRPVLLKKGLKRLSFHMKRIGGTGTVHVYFADIYGGRLDLGSTIAIEEIGDDWEKVSIAFDEGTIREWSERTGREIQWPLTRLTLRFKECREAEVLMKRIDAEYDN